MLFFHATYYSRDLLSYWLQDTWHAIYIHTANDLIALYRQFKVIGIFHETDRGTSQTDNDDIDGNSGPPNKLHTNASSASFDLLRPPDVAAL